ncbi:Hypothetical predicted protein, partial [Pelobates cultripes]
MASEEFQSLLDSTMAQSINKALASAMGVMSSSITQSVTKALIQSQSCGPQSTLNPGTTNVVQPGRKALTKSKHIASPPELQVQPAMTGTPQAVKDGAIPPCNRAPGRAKSARSWKRARAQEDSSDSDRSLEEEYDDLCMDHYSAEYSDSGSEVKFHTATQKATAQGAEPAVSGEGDDLRDPL